MDPPHFGEMAQFQKENLLYIYVFMSDTGGFSMIAENFDMAQRHLSLNQDRLKEIYFFYSELDFEGAISND